jgi:glycosyltransferase involved in cell wall biosynthesis
MTAHGDLSIVSIIPLYNGARWIEGTIRSVFTQTVQPDEFIVVDDGSTDDGPAIVEKLAQERPITLLRKPNGGQSAARNFGVAHSRSALIALLDQDDRWYPNHLEALQRAFAAQDGMPLGWAYSDFDDIDSDGLMVNRMYVSTPLLENPKRKLGTLLSQGVIIQPSSTIISRIAFEEIGGFDERLCGYEDDDLFLRIFRAGYDNAYISSSTSQWRIFIHRHAEPPTAMTLPCDFMLTSYWQRIQTISGADTTILETPLHPVSSISGLGCTFGLPGTEITQKCMNMLIIP